MIFNVIHQVEVLITTKLPESVRIHYLDVLINHLAASQYRIKLFVQCFVAVLTLLHVIFTCLSLYGIYSCRPYFLRPLLVDIFGSFLFLLFFVIFSVFCYMRVSTLGSVAERETTKAQFRNMYIGVGFLIAYVLWAIVTCLAYADTKKLRADFMYWIVEERMSMRSRHNVSVDNRSDRSSKGSKASRASKTSARSAKSEKVIDHSNSCNVSLCKRMSIANARLSVPL
ncbi:unnamed protein product [Caenorhabditis auriculariae]|uniref:Uncharacterized protein n=1 Tax=Caenorhabditis auriculariae TaxID=2777116 RepID=A0A8S1HH12_9PELO|nr:unnamed protein product [Caenorhabditis auriculariae]